jgi:hypothetical protein
MRLLGIVSALLLGGAFLVAQQPPQNQASTDTNQPSASQDSGAPANPPATPGAQAPGGQGMRGQAGGRGRAFRGQGVVGTISAINGNTVTLKSFNGGTATVNITSQTMFRKDQQSAKLSDFKVGDMVFVRGEPTGENTWTAVAMGIRSDASRRFREGMGKEFVAGEIKSIDGLNLTITRVDGVTQKITVNENTSFRKNGESVTLADFAPGDHIFARGAMKDGTFVPSMLSAGQPERPGVGMGTPGGEHMGPPPQDQPPPKEGPAKDGANPQQ